MRILAIFKFDWSDKFDIVYIDVARSVTYDLVNFCISSMGLFATKLPKI